MSSTVENRVFVNNLPAESNQESVAAHFAQFGATTDVYLPSVFGQPGRHKGIAYVTFELAEAKDTALAHPVHDILGQQVNVQVCMAKGQGKSAPLPGSTASGDNRVFVQGIGQEVLQEEVQAYFAQFGTWSDIFMPKGSYTAGHKGICFISYNGPDSVTQVMNSGPHLLGGQQVTVDLAIARDVKGGGKGKDGKVGGKGFGGFGGGKMPQPYYQPQQQYQPRYIQPPRPPQHYQQPQQLYQPPQHHFQQQNPFGVMPPPRPLTGTPTGQVIPGRLFLTKMTHGTTQDDLQNYFSQFGELNDVYIPAGGKGIAFIGFNEPSIAESVAAMQTHEVRPGASCIAEAAIERAGGKGKDKGKGKGRDGPY